MHKFMRTVGFSMYQKKQDIDRLLPAWPESGQTPHAWMKKTARGLCEIRAEVAPGMGIVLVGHISPRGTFSREYYFPMC